MHQRAFVNLSTRGSSLFCYFVIICYFDKLKLFIKLSQLSLLQWPKETVAAAEEGTFVMMESPNIMVFGESGVSVIVIAITWSEGC